MKRKRFSIFVLAVVVVLVLAAAAGTLGFKSYYKASETPVSLGLSEKVDSFIMPVRLIAHRGFSGLAPENTIPAVKAAADADYDGCEFDIRLTADEQWVVFHDDDVSRMTDGEGLVSEMTLEQVRALRIDAGNNVIQYPDEQVPTLEEMLKACVDYGIAPVIEIKTEDGQAPDYAYLAGVIRGMGFADARILSFDMDALTGLKEYLPDGAYWFLTSKVTTQQIQLCVQNGVQGIGFNASRKSNLRYIDNIADEGLVVSAWTVDNIHLLDRLYDKGVFYITTNMIYPV